VVRLAGDDVALLAAEEVRNALDGHVVALSCTLDSLASVSRHAAASPRRARAEVNMISLASAPMRSATCLRAPSTASSLCQPYRCVRLCGLPYCSTKKGSMASSTRGSTGVVACGQRECQGGATRLNQSARLHVQVQRLAAHVRALHLHLARVILVRGGRLEAREAARPATAAGAGGLCTRGRQRPPRRAARA
jgi:hypothetical protein